MNRHGAMALVTPVANSSIVRCALQSGKLLKYPLSGAARLLVVSHIREAESCIENSVESIRLLQLCSSIRTSPTVEKAAERLEATKKEIARIKVWMQ